MTRLNQRIKRLVPYKTREGALARSAAVSTDPSVVKVRGGYVGLGSPHVDLYGNPFHHLLGARGTWAVRR